MTELSELVERLRAGDTFAKQEDCRHDRCNCALLDEAAAAIERLERERDEAEQRRNYSFAKMNDALGNVAVANKRISEMQENNSAMAEKWTSLVARAITAEAELDDARAYVIAVDGTLQVANEDNAGLEAQLAKVREALRVAKSALALLTELEGIQTTSPQQAWAQAVEAQAIARRALSEPDKEGMR